jgi:hypothetical protein
MEPIKEKLLNGGFIFTGIEKIKIKVLINLIN